MNIRHKKCTTLCFSLMFSIPIFLSAFFMKENLVQAQHAGGGIIDTSKQPGKELRSYHQSFAPYEGTVQIPWIDEKPSPVSIKITETITYEIPVDEKKFNEKKLTVEDLELNEVKNNSEINFHQVDCLFFKIIKQTQTRAIENLVCTRERDGTQYWLSDGKKYVEWGSWSNWKIEKETIGIETAEKKP
ncbi:hypothetical protein B188_26720 [Candidatus Brocadiaceae bacterium B188]|nr:MAG: hypothetical protein B6D34_06455 [Candidatus Brocadia sp. UTAMX1]TWU50241.1 hypothetical protein B188_26720 [Candidatus Brocadiaceae bacterium B188]